MKFTSAFLFLLAASFCLSSVLGFTTRVDSPEGLNVRASPNTQSRVLSVIPNGASFDVDCMVSGEQAHGFRGVSNTWYHVPSRGGYVSSVWVSSPQSVGSCGGPAKPNTGSEYLNIRSSPSSQGGFAGSFPPNAELNIDCQTTGENVSGLSGTTNVWYHVAGRGYVSGAFVSTGGRGFPACSGGPGPNNADCSAGLPNPRSCSEAVAWAESRLTTSYNSEYRGLCDHFVGLAYGRAYSTFDTALIHWNTTPERFRHYDRNPPRGALVFFRSQSGNGHATISTGGEGVISTDYPNYGNLGRTSISWIESNWGAPYLGWTAPYFHNA